MKKYIITLIAIFAIAAVEAQTPFNGRIRHFDGSGIKAMVKVKDVLDLPTLSPTTRYI